MTPEMFIPHEIQTLARAWLNRLQQRDAAGCANLYADYGLIYSDAPPVSAVGRDAILAVHKAWFDAGEINQKLNLIKGNLAGDLGYFLAGWRGDFPQEDGSYRTYSGMVLTVLQREVDGEWRFQVSSLTPDTPTGPE